MSKDSYKIEEASKEITLAQLEKLKLEVDELKHKNQWERLIGRFIPLITTVLAIGGFWFTVNQFTAQQKKEMQIKEQEQEPRKESQIEDCLTHMLSSISEKKEGAATILLWLDKLDTLVRYNPREKEKVLKIIIRFIHDDCDFNNPKHATMDIDTMSQWNDYQQFLIDNSGMNDSIMFKYTQALKNIYEEDRKYFDSMRYEKGYGYRTRYFTEEQRYVRFVRLVEGFSLHLKLVPSGSNEIEKHIKQFVKAVNNPVLTAQLIDAEVLPYLPTSTVRPQPQPQNLRPRAARRPISIPTAAASRRK